MRAANAPSMLLGGTEGSNRRSALLPYVGAVILTAAATLLRWLLDPVLGDHLPFITYFVAIVYTAWYGGLGPALLGVALGCAAADWWFIQPRASVAVASSASLTGMVMYVVVGLSVATMSGSQRRLRFAAERLAREANEKREQLEQEIAERKRVEAALGESESRFRVAAHVAPVMIWMSGTDKHCDFFNKPWLEFTGRALEEELGEGWTAGVHPDDLAGCLSTYAEAFDARQSFRMEYRLRRHDGEYRWILDTGVPRYEPDGQFAGYVGSCIDITDRMQAEQALRDSETRARAILETAVDGFIVIDERGIVDSFNPAAERLFGYGRDEVIGKNVSMLMPEPYRAEHDGYLERYHQTGERKIIGIGREVVGRRKDGTVFPMELAVSEMRLRERRMYTGMVHDITERKQAEAQLLQAKEAAETARRQAEEANRTKDEFLATLSHELRTPLNAILGWARLLQGGKADADTASQAIEVIERNAIAQAQLIEDLLDVSRIISGKLRLDVRAVDLASVIDATTDALHPAAEAREIRISRVLDPSAGPVLGDPTRLQQVVWNLVSNAIKFTPRHGRVQVELRRVNSHVEVLVSDNGKGIEPDFLPYVFDRFRQGDASSTRAHGGLGLGLAIVRHVVELHGGSVQADSKGPGRGATFTVKLPLMAFRRDPEGTPREHPTATTHVGFDDAPALQGVRALVVEDEPDAARLIKTVLERRRAEVVTVNSAAAALAELPRFKPDVLISDIGMPGEDGYSLIRKVRQLGQERGGQVPAVALTAFARAEDRMRCLAAGFQMHVAKPVEPAELATVVASLVGRSRPE